MTLRTQCTKERCDAGYGIEANETGEGVLLRFSTDEIMKKGREAAIAKR